MKRLLVGLVIWAFSSTALAAEPIVHNGQEGVFFTTEQAKKLLEKVEVELPALQAENALLKKEVAISKALQSVLDERLKAESEISNKWQENYKASLKELSKYRSRNDIKFYIYAGIFITGTITGGLIMYGSSLLVRNIR